MKIKNNNNVLIDEKVLFKTKDIQSFLDKIYKRSKRETRLLIKKSNFFWKDENNWIDIEDVKGFLKLSNFEIITENKNYLISKPIKKTDKDFSVSIIIAARNEEGNISKIVPSIPKFGKWQEVIFVEGHSKDNTWQKIVETTKKIYRKNLKVKAIKQRGIGKADAVRLGLKKAKGEILMIYDADRTVEANDLTKFYLALKENKGEFINGCRLIYPMEKDAMQLLNKIGNKFFGVLFTWIFGQRFKDTLCGTKAFFKKDYLKFKRFKDDPFGDFEFIFGAIENNLKVVEIPVRYKERVYGTTNISRFKHGLLLFKITWIAFARFKLFI